MWGWLCEGIPGGSRQTPGYRAEPSRADHSERDTGQPEEALIYGSHCRSCFSSASSSSSFPLRLLSHSSLSSLLLERADASEPLHTGVFLQRYLTGSVWTYEHNASIQTRRCSGLHSHGPAGFTGWRLKSFLLSFHTWRLQSSMDFTLFWLLATTLMLIHQFQGKTCPKLHNLVFYCWYGWGPVSKPNWELCFKIASICIFSLYTVLQWGSSSSVISLS